MVRYAYKVCSYFSQKIKRFNRRVDFSVDMLSKGDPTMGIHSTMSHL